MKDKNVNNVEDEDALDVNTNEIAEENVDEGCR